MKVISWNVNSVGMRLERLLKLLDRHAPDFVCLQELKCIDEKFPLEAIRAKGYFASVFGQKTYNGVAVLTREAPTEVVRGLLGEGDDGSARLIGVTAAGIRGYSAYFPNGQAVGTKPYEFKLAWFRRLREYLDHHYRKDTPLFLAGDFNVAPEDRDVHDPDAWRGSILFSDPEKAALAKLREFGLHDTFRKFNSDKGLYSWWDYRQLAFPFNKGLRIDFILATTPLYERCTAASIDRDERKGEKPSDHAPVIAEFDI